MGCTKFTGRGSEEGSAEKNLINFQFKCQIKNGGRKQNLYTDEVEQFEKNGKNFYFWFVLVSTQKTLQNVQIFGF